MVTGATRGIGRAIATAFRGQGAIVIGVSSSKIGDTSACSEHVIADLSSKRSTMDLADRLRMMEPDILINNAGMNKIGPFATIALEEFCRIQQVNVFAPFVLCQAVIPGMKRKGWGRIVNVSSIWGKIGKEGRASYAASKFALDGMTLALAAEHSQNGILANCVAPGFIDTELTRSILSVHELNTLVAQVPAKRLGTAEEIARFVVWLGGPENTYITGQNLSIDGGFARV